MNDVRVERVRVTPALAEEWLKLNRKNRPLKTTAVRRYAEVMWRGQWRLSNDAIVFNEDGDLANGQNRLTAIVESGVDCDFVVIHGMDRQAAETYDIGARRTGADLLSMEGFDDGRGYAAAYHALLTLRAMWAGHPVTFGGGNADKRPTMQDIRIAALSEFIGDSMAIGNRFRGSPTRVPPALVTALHHEMASVAPNEATRFFDRLNDGEELRAGDPIYRLRQSFLADAVSQSTRRRNRTVQAALIVKTWNHWREGRSGVQVVSWKREVEPFPQILEKASPEYRKVYRKAAGLFQAKQGEQVEQAAAI